MYITTVQRGAGAGVRPPRRPTRARTPPRDSAVLEESRGGGGGQHSGNIGGARAAARSLIRLRKMGRPIFRRRIRLRAAGEDYRH